MGHVMTSSPTSTTLSKQHVPHAARVFIPHTPRFLRRRFLLPPPWRVVALPGVEPRERITVRRGCCRLDEVFFSNLRKSARVATRVASTVSTAGSRINYM